MEATAYPSVVVPVYNAKPVLSACLQALSDTLPESVRVLLINDASTDDSIQSLLETAVQRQSNWECMQHDRNLGFVATANQGFRHCDGDVVLLNSDTLPAGSWLQLLSRCAAENPQAATITPWSNNGEIVSIPVFCQPNPLPPDVERLAQAVVSAGSPEYPRIPTAVGFCMYLTRRALDRLGDFDQQSFGLGYGEENDFSMRASAAGMDNILCDNAYVAHVGNQSFGPRGLAPNEAAMQALLRKHPDYLQLISEYIDADPLRARRERILDQIRRQGVSLG